jgi:hypothetical protein
MIRNSKHNKQDFINVPSIVDIVASDVAIPPPVLETLPVAYALAPGLLDLMVAVSFVLLESALILKFL